MTISSINAARGFADFAQVVNVLRRSVHVSNSVRIYTSRDFLLQSLGICKRPGMDADLYERFVRYFRQWECWRRMILENTSAGHGRGCAFWGSHWMGGCCCVDRVIMGPCDLSKVSI